MTFEELLDLVDKMNGEAGYATGGDVDSLVYSGLDVHLMLEEIKSCIEQLQETYAPKIKMTKNESEMIKKMKKVSQISVGIVDYSKREPKVLLSNELKFVDAWLHPELIEVSDDSSRID